MSAAELDDLARQIEAMIKDVQRTEITVGIQEEQGAQAAAESPIAKTPPTDVPKNPNPYRGEAARVEQSGPNPTTLEIAIWNHYGTRKIPPRPWLSYADEAWGETWLDAWVEGIMGVVEGKPIAFYEQTIRQIGVVAVDDCKQVLTDLRDPPNAPFTVAMKGSDNPLQDTGHLRDSHRAKVTIGQSTEVIG